jgi:hypothetical protein
LSGGINSAAPTMFFWNRGNCDLIIVVTGFATGPLGAADCCARVLATEKTKPRQSTAKPRFFMISSRVSRRVSESPRKAYPKRFSDAACLEAEINPQYEGSSALDVLEGQKNRNRSK